MRNRMFISDKNLIKIENMDNFERAKELQKMLDNYQNYDLKDTRKLLLLVTYLKEEIECALENYDENDRNVFMESVEQLEVIESVMSK